MAWHFACVLSGRKAQFMVYPITAHCPVAEEEKKPWTCTENWRFWAPETPHQFHCHSRIIFPKCCVMLNRCIKLNRSPHQFCFHLIGPTKSCCVTLSILMDINDFVWSNSILFHSRLGRVFLRTFFFFNPTSCCELLWNFWTYIKDETMVWLKTQLSFLINNNNNKRLLISSSRRPSLVWMIFNFFLHKIIKPAFCIYLRYPFLS